MSIGVSIGDIISGVDMLVRLFIKSGIFHKDMYYIEREDIRLECASLAKDIAEINRNLCPDSITHRYTVNNTRLICDLSYRGVVKKNDVSEILFTFTTTNQTNYEKMDCYAIENDKKQKPQLVGPDGLIKKLSVRFSEMKNKDEIYSVDVHIDLGKCIVARREYILSILKYKKITSNEYNVIIEFKKTEVPDNIRVYELQNGKMKYEKTIYSENNVFVDEIDKPDSISLRAYIFDRR